MTDYAARVVAEAESWIGTPFRQGAGRKGPHGGVDCGQFLLRVYQGAGLVPPGDAPPYPLNWFLHRGNADLFTPWLRRHGALVTSGGALPGDVVTFRVARAPHGHVAIVTEWPNIIHAWPREGVVRGVATSGVLRGRLASCWRYAEAS